MKNKLGRRWTAPSTLAEYLRTAREQAGISQRQLASRVGIHNSYLARLENGETANPAAELLQRIADVLEISSTDLLGVHRGEATGRAARVGTIS